jgi:hypothetical protein
LGERLDERLQERAYHVLTIGKSSPCSRAQAIASW